MSTTTRFDTRISDATRGLGLTLLRLAVGTIFLYHGIDKLFGGMPATVGLFESVGIPLPAVSAWITALLELVAGAAVLLGVWVRPAAALLIPIMAVAILTVHGPNGFANVQIVGMENGAPVFGMPGWEYNLALIGALAMLAFGGAGRWALTSRIGGGREAGGSAYAREVG